MYLNIRWLRWNPLSTPIPRRSSYVSLSNLFLLSLHLLDRDEVWDKALYEGLYLKSIASQSSRDFFKNRNLFIRQTKKKTLLCLITSGGRYVLIIHLWILKFEKSKCDSKPSSTKNAYINMYLWTKMDTTSVSEVQPILAWYQMQFCNNYANEKQEYS